MNAFATLWLCRFSNARIDPTVNYAVGCTGSLCKSRKRKMVSGAHPALAANSEGLVMKFGLVGL